MTVSTTANRIAYDGDGTTTAFTIPFPFTAAGDIYLYLNGAQQSVGYSVAGAGGQSGVLTCAAPPASAANVVIVRSPAPLQKTKLPLNGPFPSLSVEGGLDLLTMLVQRALDLAGRAFRLPDGDPDLSTPDLPGAADRAGKLLSFDVDGNPQTIAPVGGSATALAIALGSSDGFSNIGGFTSYAAFRAYTGTAARVMVTGLLVTAHSGIYGEFYRTNDTTRADDGATFIRLNNGVGYQRVFKGGTDPRWWLALGGNADDTIPLTQCFANSKFVQLDDIFSGKNIPVTNPKLRVIGGAGGLKLLDNSAYAGMPTGQVAKLLIITGTNELSLEFADVDGNKANQYGASQGRRGDYFLIDVVDKTAVGTQFRNGIKIHDAYYGAAVNNSGIRTTFDGFFVYNCGKGNRDGECDGIFCGTDALGTVVMNGHIDKCSDYGLAGDTSNLTTMNLTISGCYAGMGALTRRQISGHRHINMTVYQCTLPVDYFNATSDSDVRNLFVDIAFDGGAFSSDTNTTSIINFSANNATTKLCDNVRFIGAMTINTRGNVCSAISIGGLPANPNSNVTIDGVNIVGDGTSLTAKYAINVTNTRDLKIRNVTFDGVDLGMALTGVQGKTAGNIWRGIRDLFGVIESCDLDIDESVSFARRGMLVTNGSRIVVSLKLDEVVMGILLYSAAGSAPCSVYVRKMFLSGTAQAASIFVDGPIQHRVEFEVQPTGPTPFTSNLTQAEWNINTTPTAGPWRTGARVFYPTASVTGQPIEKYCRSGGTFGATAPVFKDLTVVPA